MRTPVSAILVSYLLALGIWFSWNGTSATADSNRLKAVRPGMTRTDVVVELGKPIDVRADQEGTYWTYPASPTEICTIRFVKQKVANENVKCDKSEAVKELAEKSAYMIPRMNSDTEYKTRVDRYCGRKPTPRPGCVISPQCVNGGWEEVCK